jgi:hypothetical protein
MVLLSGIPLPTSLGSDPAIRKRRVALQELDFRETGTLLSEKIIDMFDPPQGLLY